MNSRKEMVNVKKGQLDIIPEVTKQTVRPEKGSLEYNIRITSPEIKSGLKNPGGSITR